MYTNEEVNVIMNKLAKRYLEALKRSRWSKVEKEENLNEFKKEMSEGITKVTVGKGITKVTVGKGIKKVYSKGNGNRWCAKKYFLTIPKTNAPKREVLEYYLNNMNIAKAAIAQERHKDGSKHLHVYLEFVVKKDIKNVSFFNLPDNFKEYGNVNVNVDTIKKHTKENVYTYMCKTDKNVYSYGFNIRMDAYGKLKPKEVWYKVAIGEWEIGDVVKYDPSYLIKNIPKLHNRVQDNLKYLEKYFKVDFVF